MCTRSHPYTHTLCAHAHIGSLHYPLKVGARRNCAACYDKYKKHDARSAKSPWRRALLFVLDEPRSSALVSKLREGGSDSGQLDLRGPLPAPQIVPATGGPKPRPASANQPAGPRWPATHRPWFRHRSAPAFALYAVLTNPNPNPNPNIGPPPPSRSTSCSCSTSSCRSSCSTCRPY